MATTDAWFVFLTYLTSKRRFYYHFLYCIPDFERGARKVLYEAVFSTTLSNMFKLESLSWLLKLSSN